MSRDSYFLSFHLVLWNVNFWIIDTPNAIMYLN